MSERIQSSMLFGLLAIVLWLALSYWWRLSVLINSRIAPEVPIYLLLAFGVLFLVGTKAAVRSKKPGTPGTRKENTILVVAIALGIVGCFLTGVVCFAFSGAPAASFPPAVELSGFAASSTMVSLPIYIGLTEELAFRGVFQRRLSAAFGAWNSIAIATGLFLTLHWFNQGFEAFWPFYLSISVVCGIFAAQFDSLLGVFLVHGGVNLAGAALPDALNSAAEFLRRPVVEMALILVVGLAAAGLGYCVRSRSSSLAQRTAPTG